MPLIKHDIGTNAHEIVSNDPWTVVVRDADALPTAGGHIIVSLDLVDQAIANGISPLGVEMSGDELVEDLAPHLDKLDAVFVHFKSFANGTGFSTAHMLRERYGFKGEIRATGHVIRDQFAYLIRCGVNAVEARTDADAEAWAESLSRFSVVYQPGLDSRPWAEKLRRYSAA